MKKGRLTEINDEAYCGDIIMSLQDFELLEETDWGEKAEDDAGDEQLPPPHSV